MTNEPEWRDANPATEDLPNKGRTVILFIAGGIAIGVLTFIGMRVRPLGLFVGVAAFFAGISILLRRRKAIFKTGVVITVTGFLMLLTHPRFGIAASFAGYFLIVGAIGLVVLGLFKAIKLSWDLGQRS
ncbi:MAG: hypothetical protein LBQ82_08880 [Treponema sp.]|jgi:uncharacterized membrane protein YhaH (DUF805 family)|nr:hypothetical protein [Treponema sp.]